MLSTKFAKAVLCQALEDGLVSLSDQWQDDGSDPAPADPRSRPEEELAGVTKILEQQLETAVLLGMQVRSECRDGHWTAWFVDTPETAFGGETEPAAVQALLRSETRPGSPCGACGGSGKYRGLHEVQPCQECAGTGRQWSELCGR